MGLDIRTLTTKWSRKQLDDTNHNFKQLKENIGTVDENAVGSEQLKEESVGTMELKKEAVTTEKMAKNSVDETLLKNDAVNRKKLNTTVETELDIYAENNINKNFEILNKNFFQLGTSMPWYSKNFGSINEIILIGFDSTKEHRLRLIARNHSTFKYRFIICSRNSSADVWTDVFDSKAGFLVTENPKGLTTVSHTIGDKTVILKVDYNQMIEDSINDGALGINEGRYQIKSKCFFQNSIQSVKQNVEKLDTIVSSLNSKRLIVLKIDKDIKIKYKKNDLTNQIINFDELGINKIIHPKRFYEEKATRLTSDFSNINLTYTLETDWISPYQNVQAKNGGINSFSGTVGGNHGTDGAGGFPTAETIDLEVLVDNRKINNNQVAAGGVVTVVVKNMITASNKIDLTTGSKSQSLLETVVYKITESNIEVFVNIEALEDLSIGGYVGLQMTTDILPSGEIYFLDGTTKHKADGIFHNSLPLPFSNDRVVFEKDNQVIVIQTKRNYGIGDLRYKVTAPIHFVSEFNKIYSHLVNKNISLNVGQSLEYSGSYTFMDKLKCEDSEAAYITVENGEIIYCVDFLKSVNETYLEIQLNNIGKKIVVINSKNVTSQDMIGFKGLKLKADDVGYIKFKIIN